MNLDPNIRKAEQERDDVLKEAEAKMDTSDHEKLHPPEDDHRPEQLRRDVHQPDHEPASSSTEGRADAGPEHFDIDPLSLATTASYETVKEDEAIGEVGALAKGGRAGVDMEFQRGNAADQKGVIFVMGQTTMISCSPRRDGF